MVLDEGMLVDGALVAAGRGRTYENRDPATGEVLAAVPDADATDVEWAVGAARRAFDTTSWATDTAFRRHCLAQLATALRAHAEMLRALVVCEAGAPVALTRTTQLDVPLDFVDRHIELLDRYEVECDLAREHLADRSRRWWVHRAPAGVVAALLPANYPLYAAVATVGAALAAGCTVVLGPAVETPSSVLALGRIALEHTDIPVGVLNIVTTSDAAVREVITAHPAVDLVALAGSTGCRPPLLASAASRVVRIARELDGKSTAVLLDDVDLASVMPALVTGAFTHAGQGGAALSRILVPRARHDEAVASAAELVRRIRWGDPMDPAHLMGPLVNTRSRARVLRHRRAAAREGTVLVDGRPAGAGARGHFVAPALVSGVSPKSAVARELVNGPTLTVLAYDDDDAAVRIADEAVHGPFSFVHGVDEERAVALARRLRATAVEVNPLPSTAAGWPLAALPPGAPDHAGDLREFLDAKTVAVTDRPHAHR